MTLKQLPAKAKAAASAAVGAWSKADKPVHVEPPDDIDNVRSNFRRIMIEYALGTSLETIGQSLEHKMTAVQIRVAIGHDRALRAQFYAIREHLADNIFERSIEVAIKAERSGEYATAFAAYQKIVEKLAPAKYGARLALVGGNPDEAPVQVEHSGGVNVTLTPSEAYKQMLEGKV